MLLRWLNWTWSCFTLRFLLISLCCFTKEFVAELVRLVSVLVLVRSSVQLLSLQQLVPDLIGFYFIADFTVASILFLYLVILVCLVFLALPAGF